MQITNQTVLAVAAALQEFAENKNHYYDNMKEIYNETCRRYAAGENAEDGLLTFLEQ
jgi:hypothetical protein